MIDESNLPDESRAGYDAIRATAVRLAGGPGDIAQRVMLHHQIYRDSRGNHAFPLVALHGALWAAGFFETTGRLGDALRARYFYSSKERDFRMTMLRGFAEGFKTVNRQVFVDTFTNYYFTKHYGDRTDATGFMNADLFTALNNVHTATRAGAALSALDKRLVFGLALTFEQEVTVAPGVEAEVARFDCPVLTFLCLRPLVRFLYFPKRRYFWFRNFANKTERIAKAMASYDLAERIGWSNVEAAMQLSPVLPAAFWSDPSAFVRSKLA